MNNIIGVDIFIRHKNEYIILENKFTEISIIRTEIIPFLGSYLMFCKKDYKTNKYKDIIEQGVLIESIIFDYITPTQVRIEINTKTIC